jgi:hypothetical protein
MRTFHSDTFLATILSRPDKYAPPTRIEPPHRGYVPVAIAVLVAVAAVLVVIPEGDLLLSLPLHLPSS